MSAAIRVQVSLACDACGSPIGADDVDQTLCRKCRPPPSRRFYFTAQEKGGGSYHATSGYAFGVTPFAALASACRAIKGERPKGGTYEISLSTNDNGPDRPWLTHWFGGVDVQAGSYAAHVDTAEKARR